MSYLCTYSLANNYFPNSEGSFLFSLLFSDSLRLANAAPRWAWQVVSPCLFIPRCGLPRPLSVVQTHTLTYYTHRQIQTGHSFRSRAGRVKKAVLSVLCHTYALDVSASLTGSTVCLYRKCTWGRRPSAQWTGSTSTAHTSPEWRPSMRVEWASTARRWSCRPLRVRWASSPPPASYLTIFFLRENTLSKQNTLIYSSDLRSTRFESRKSQDSSLCCQ